MGSSVVRRERDVTGRTDCGGEGNSDIDMDLHPAMHRQDDLDRSMRSNLPKVDWSSSVRTRPGTSAGRKHGSEGGNVVRNLAGRIAEDDIFSLFSRLRFLAAILIRRLRLQHVPGQGECPAGHAQEHTPGNHEEPRWMIDSTRDSTNRE